MFVFLFVCCMLVPISMIGLGYYWKYYPPQDIDAFYGYRTSMSMINQDTWDFAHRYFGRIWYLSGIITAVISAIILIAIKDSSKFEQYTIYLIVIQCFILCAGIIPTEIALKKHFDKNGYRK